jgi:ArsR family transcriptional regulator, lead/cadmium/zinc/bismuth-responsive transcriptional repressor
LLGFRERGEHALTLRRTCAPQSAHRHDHELIGHAATHARALSDATRLTVATALQQGGELCVCDLAWITGRAENLIGHHLRTLRDAGLASSRRDGKIVFYALTKLGYELLEALLQQALATASAEADQ